MITISCIYFQPSPPGEIQHKLVGQCVFTSVDVILLMERIFEHPPFEIQEKNRIRRNLESFKPETIKKEGTTNRFFAQLMAYTQPKTRNIEKDIKVFVWSDIMRAMKKIVVQFKNNDLARQRKESSLQGITSHPSENVWTPQPFVDNLDDYTQYSPQTLEPESSFLSQEYSYPSSINPSVQMYLSQDESGDSSGSMSPEAHVSQLLMPSEYAHAQGNYVAGPQGFRNYLQGMSGYDM
jgi:hypothetical protein